MSHNVEKCGCTACMVERATSVGTRAIRVDPDVKRMLDAERKPSDPNYSVVIRRLLRKSA